MKLHVPSYVHHIKFVCYGYDFFVGYSVRVLRIYSAQMNSARNVLRALKNYIRCIIRTHTLANGRTYGGKRRASVWHQTPILNMLKLVPFIHFARFVRMFYSSFTPVFYLLIFFSSSTFAATDADDTAVHLGRANGTKSE